MQTLIKSFLFLSILLYGCTPSPTSDSNSTAIHEDSVLVFKATGNEPFWGLEINENRKMRFHTLTHDNINRESSLPKASLHIQDTLIYSIGSENDSLSISIIRNPCEDTMSGEKRPLNVTVSIKEKDGDITDFFGCGKYLYEYEINGSWKLRSINDNPIHLNSQGKRPFLEIHLLEKRVFGFAGCNRFSGKVELIDGKLNFGPIVSTKMACAEMGIENQLFESLSNKTMSFERTDDGLKLNSGETVLKFLRN